MTTNPDSNKSADKPTADEVQDGVERAWLYGILTQLLIAAKQKRLLPLLDKVFNQKNRTHHD